MMRNDQESSTSKATNYSVQTSVTRYDSADHLHSGSQREMPELTTIENKLLDQLKASSPKRVSVEVLKDVTAANSIGSVRTHLSTMRIKKHIPISHGNKEGYCLLDSPSSAISSERPRPHESARIEYNWENVLKGAKKIRRRVFFGRPFSANVIVTFQGASGILGNLVVALHKQAQHELPVFLFLVREWKRSNNNEEPLPLPGYEKAWPGENVAIYIPIGFKKLIADRKESKKSIRIAVIDDIVVSGVVPDAVRSYFRKLFGGQKNMTKSVYLACFACVDTLKDVPDHGPDYAAAWPPTKKIKLPGWPTVFYGRGRK